MLTFDTPLLTMLALLIEAACGYPGALLRWIGHPVIWIGAAIAWLDRTLNRGRARRLRGVAALLVLLVLSGLPAWALQAAVLRVLPQPAAWAVLELYSRIPAAS